MRKNSKWGNKGTQVLTEAFGCHAHHYKRLAVSIEVQFYWDRQASIMVHKAQKASKYK